MDFIKKAKSSLKELESDLTKATQSLGLGDKSNPSNPSNQRDAPPPNVAPAQYPPTPYAPAAYTPPTTTGPVNTISTDGGNGAGAPPTPNPVPRFVGAGQLDTKVEPKDESSPAKLPMVVRKNGMSHSPSTRVLALLTQYHSPRRMGGQDQPAPAASLAGLANELSRVRGRRTGVLLRRGWVCD